MLNKELIELLKKEIQFYELNPTVEEFKDDEVYLLKRYIIAINDNGSDIIKLIMNLSEHTPKEILSQ